jgi:transcriptional regulator with XRE-family HTH domain
MTGEELKAWRESQGLTEKDLASLLNEPLGRKYGADTVRRWEKGERNLPRGVVDFLAGGAASTTASGGEGGGDPSSPGAPLAPGEDLPPRAQPDSKPALLPVLSGGEYAKACEDLWDMIGFGLVAAGTGLGRPAIRSDGYIICGWEDATGKHEGLKRELGVAYGKLAERNRTFQRLVLALSQESVWAEVVIVTAKLAQQMYANHMRYATLEAEKRAPSRQARGEPEAPSPEQVFEAREERAA